MNVIAVGIALAIVLPAAVMASKRSSYLVDYFLFVIALNRGMRRIIDYANGSFDPFSPISLTPLIIGLLGASLVLPALSSRRGSFLSDGRLRQALVAYLVACAVAFVAGTLYNGLAAVYELGDYLGAFGLLGTAILHAKSPPTMRRWFQSSVASAVVVAIYGLYQYYLIPPWDAFWVRAVGFEGYLGSLRSTRMTVFSTMAERGPAAAYLAFNLILLLLRPRLSGSLRWPLSVLLTTVLLLTMVRSCLIQIAAALLIYPLVNRGAGTIRLVAVVLFISIAGEGLVQLLPSADLVLSRVGTLQDVNEDGSFRGRIELIGIAASAIVSHPLGVGFGSHGLGGRVNTGSTVQSDSLGVADSGFMQVLLTFGVIGSMFYISVLIRIWSASQRVAVQAPDDLDNRLFRAMLLSGLVLLFSGNWLGSPSIFWVLGGYVLGRGFRTAGATNGSSAPRVAAARPWAVTRRRVPMRP